MPCFDIRLMNILYDILTCLDLSRMFRKRLANFAPPVQSLGKSETRAAVFGKVPLPDVSVNR